MPAAAAAPSVAQVAPVHTEVTEQTLPRPDLPHDEQIPARHAPEHAPPQAEALPQAAVLQVKSSWMLRKETILDPSWKHRIVKTLMIGIPGSGKSTLLNLLHGFASFRGGVTSDTGITREIQFATSQSFWGCKSGEYQVFVDSPGLGDADGSHNCDAAKAITDVFKMGGHFRIIFILTLSGGRPRQTDVKNMQAVLKAAPQIVEYGIIINKVSTSEFRKLCNGTSDSKDERPFKEKLLQRLEGLVGVPVNYNHVCIYRDLEEIHETCQDLEKGEQMPVQMPEGIQHHIQNIPTTWIMEEDVKDVQVTEEDRQRSDAVSQEEDREMSPDELLQSANRIAQQVGDYKEKIEHTLKLSNETLPARLKEFLVTKKDALKAQLESAKSAAQVAKKAKTAGQKVVKGSFKHLAAATRIVVDSAEKNPRALAVAAAVTTFCFI